MDLWTDSRPTISELARLFLASDSKHLAEVVVPAEHFSHSEESNQIIRDELVIIAVLRVPLLVSARIFFCSIFLRRCTILFRVIQTALYIIADVERSCLCGLTRVNT